MSKIYKIIKTAGIYNIYSSNYHFSERKYPFTPFRVLLQDKQKNSMTAYFMDGINFQVDDYILLFCENTSLIFRFDYEVLGNFKYASPNPLLLLYDGIDYKSESDDNLENYKMEFFKSSE